MNAVSPIIERSEVSSREAGRNWWPTILLATAVVGIGYGYFWFNRKPPTATAAVALPTVSVAEPLARTVNEWDRYIGRFAPSRTVNVRPRVSGQITAIHFTDGAIVARNELLFTIDKRPFEAALAEAKAGLESAKSDLALARAEFERADRLSDSAVSKSELDRRRARMQASSAAVDAAQARVQVRQLELEFTDVRAPLAGRVSDRRVDPGNLVSAGEGANATLLTTINALDPIYFVFDASEALFLKAKRAQQSGEDASRVEIRLQDEAGYRWNGQLDFMDSGLDPRSGTIRLRAVLKNPDLFLTPGMFGNMRLSSGGAASVLLVPDAVVQTDQARKSILTVTADGTVTSKSVELGPVVEGLRVVRTGLVSDDRVVVGGIQTTAPGKKVLVRPGRIEPTILAPQSPISPISGEATFVP